MASYLQETARYVVETEVYLVEIDFLMIARCARVRFVYI